MKYRVLVLDLDGTLTNSEKKITRKTKEALIKVQENGVKVVLASGRPTYGIMPLAKELELEKYGGYILSYNGANIIDCKNESLLFETCLPEESISEIVELTRKHKVDLLSYEGETIITNNKENPYAVIESKVNGLPLKEIQRMEEYIDFPVTKFIMLAQEDYLAGVEPQVKKALGQQFSVYRSEGYFLEIMPENIDKAASLERLLVLLGLTREEMAACGDGYNDLSMLEYAGLGVAMENAVPRAKEIADYITGSNNQDGIADVVNRFFL